VTLGGDERVVSVESDSETLWRTGCERQKMGNGSKFELFGIECLDRVYIANGCDDF